ncbi:hypothetical protein GW17_00047547 [Ensete ventricosum]|nr:hypothetical protein GW17_00047547 [Ensete ventricosum]
MFDFHKVKARLTGRTPNCPAPPPSATEECPAVASERHPASMGEKHPGKGGSEPSWKKKESHRLKAPEVEVTRKPGSMAAAEKQVTEMSVEVEWLKATLSNPSSIVKITSWRLTPPIVN